MRHARPRYSSRTLVQSFCKSRAHLPAKNKNGKSLHSSSTCQQPERDCTSNPLPPQTSLFTHHLRHLKHSSSPLTFAPPKQTGVGQVGPHERGKPGYYYIKATVWQVVPVVAHRRFDPISLSLLFCSCSTPFLPIFLVPEMALSLSQPLTPRSLEQRQ